MGKTKAIFIWPSEQWWDKLWSRMYNVQQWKGTTCSLMEISATLYCTFNSTYLISPECVNLSMLCRSGPGKQTGVWCSNRLPCFAIRNFWGCLPCCFCVTAVSSATAGIAMCLSDNAVCLHVFVNWDDTALCPFQIGWFIRKTVSLVAAKEILVQFFTSGPGETSRSIIWSDKTTLCCLDFSKKRQKYNFTAHAQKKVCTNPIHHLKSLYIISDQLFILTSFCWPCCLLTLFLKSFQPRLC